MVALDSGTGPAFGVMTSHVYAFVGIGIEGFKIKNPYSAQINTHEYYLKLRESDDKLALDENKY